MQIEDRVIISGGVSQKGDFEKDVVSERCYKDSTQVHRKEKNEDKQ